MVTMRTTANLTSFFFFQAEDGIRDHCVTGVQTCALPISCPICTSSGCGAGGVIGIGFKFCGPRQLSNMPTCCTQETVHRAAQNFSVKYSRCRISGVYCASGIPGYPRCCEHQCTSPSSQMYKYREPERHRQLCSRPRATLC